jgi:hypothetical protein
MKVSAACVLLVAIAPAEPPDAGIQGSGKRLTSVTVVDPDRYDPASYVKGPYWITEGCADRWQVFGPGPLVCRVTTVPPRLGSSTL